MSDTQDVLIQRGTPRETKRDVSKDRNWLTNRIKSLRVKKQDLIDRVDSIDLEIDKRKTQLTTIKQGVDNVEKKVVGDQL